MMKKETISSDEDRLTEEICTEVLSLMQIIKHPDITENMENSKRNIYNRVNYKIDADAMVVRMKRDRRILLLKYAAAACIAVLCLIAVYQVGLRSERNIPEEAQIELHVPNGLISKVTLADGTLVTLNGGSKLVYPARFGTERQVYLSGEGFFDVSKDEKHPFTVRTENIFIRVLGTRFACKAYEEDLVTVLTLEEGQVEAISVNENGRKRNVLLKPAQQLTLNNRSGELRQKNVSTYEYTAWKDGVIHFNGETLNEIAVILERRFDTKIHILMENVENEHYVAQFKYGENVEQILDRLSHKRYWTYEKLENRIEIKKK
ncbi:MAG: FecR domain-containing protein [Dysgonamonadaceae bacterium]|jgi:ferric-dicitrate binding protein FerR (iron transport regulator)|nr:FecR domain-containing protein [Dysgonamonadaceae bacterium]